MSARWPPSVSLREANYEAITIQLKAQSVLGPNLELRDCDVVVDRGARVTCVDARFLGCRFHAERVRDFTMSRTQLVNCSFEGIYQELRFGVRESTLESCDFRNAVLHDC